MTVGSRSLLGEMLRERLTPEGRAWIERSTAELIAGASASRFASLLSSASRHAKHAALEPSAKQIDDAGRALEGWNPERWTVLEALRVALILAHPDLADASFATTLEECFRFADQGELCALYRSLGHLPGGERFTWRAGEGCRTNIRPVFEAVACDTPYPARHFDDLAWRQLVLKAIFVGAPLWRVHGLDRRLSPELARMALDFADERRSAGRPVPPELWMCLGPHGGERAIESLEREMSSSDPTARRAAALGFARADERGRLERFLDLETDAAASEGIREALEGRHDQVAFRAFDEQRR